MSDREPTFASVYDGRMAMFVEARLADDDRARDIQVAPGWGCCCGRCNPKLIAYVENWCQARTGREITAHRRILTRFRRAQTALQHADMFHAGYRGELLATSQACALALADVACIWSEHPDFDDEWRGFAVLVEDAPDAARVGLVPAIWQLPNPVGDLRSDLIEPEQLAPYVEEVRRHVAATAERLGLPLRMLQSTP